MGTNVIDGLIAFKAFLCKGEIVYLFSLFGLCFMFYLCFKLCFLFFIFVSSCLLYLLSLFQVVFHLLSLFRVVFWTKFQTGD